MPTIKKSSSNGKLHKDYILFIFQEYCGIMGFTKVISIQYKTTKTTNNLQQRDIKVSSL